MSEITMIFIWGLFFAMAVDDQISKKRSGLYSLSMSIVYLFFFILNLITMRWP